MNLKLRTWQKNAIDKALDWFTRNESNSRFLINAAPGAGKTICSAALALKMLEKRMIDRVVVIAPRVEVVKQWANDFELVSGRHMGKIEGSSSYVSDLGFDLCLTWNSVQGLGPELQAVCRSNKVLVICDEHHHAAVDASWGESTGTAFDEAAYRLLLTGTPLRSDGEASIWLAYDSMGQINQPEGGAFTLSYGEAVDLGYCRPVTFHRHHGEFQVNVAGEQVLVRSGEEPKFSDEVARIPNIAQALEFYKLVTTPQYEIDGITPKKGSYQESMIAEASAKLDEMRLRMPEAGGLVIAPSIEWAEIFAVLLERLEGERPFVVHSQTPNSSSLIEGFRRSDKRWIVSVAMISEGVDIKRLRVLVYLPCAQTELSFRQAIGRVVRTIGREDDSRAYVVMPAYETFERYARRVEGEMPSHFRRDPEPPKYKVCPVCDEQNDLGARACKFCDHEFPERSVQMSACPHCETLNPVHSKICMGCGESLGLAVDMTLREALRTGAIVRGMDIDEEDVLAAEKMAPAIRRHLLSSGDEVLVDLVKKLPEESWARLKAVLDQR